MRSTNPTLALIPPSPRLWRDNRRAARENDKFDYGDRLEALSYDFGAPICDPMRFARVTATCRAGARRAGCLELREAEQCSALRSVLASSDAPCPAMGVGWR